MNTPLRLVSILFLLVALASAAQEPFAGNAKAVGTVQSTSGNGFVLKSDAGVEVAVSVSQTTRLLRSEPGQKSLKEAAPAQLPDVQIGDRALASGKASADGKSIAASTVVLMKKNDIASRQEQERQDWQRRGVGGLVSAVDVNASTVTISTMSMGQKKEIAVHVSPTTIIRRYAPDSVKFDDAKKSTLAEIKPGDQLRARGNKHSDGSEIEAEEIVSGTFRNLSGTVQSVDKARNELTVIDLGTRKPMTVAIGTESQLRKLPEIMAQRIALRLKGGPPAGMPSGAPQPSGGQQTPPSAPPRSDDRAGMGANGGNHGGDFLQTVLNRAPVVQLSELQKGDAVMVVATEGSATSTPTVITLLAGVEPILSAGAKGSDASTILSPWNLGGSGGGDAAQ